MTKLTTTITAIFLMTLSLPAFAGVSDYIDQVPAGTCQTFEEDGKFLTVCNDTEKVQQATRTVIDDTDMVQAIEISSRVITPETPSSAPQPESAPVDIEMKDRGYSPAGVFVI